MGQNGEKIYTAPSKGLFFRYAKWYDSFMKTTHLANVNNIASLLPSAPKLKVVDIGGGTGTLANLLLNNGLDVTIVDPSVPMTKIAVRKNPKVKVVNADAEQISLPSAQYDVVCFRDALHHIENQDQALGEAVRLLKPHGRIVVQEFLPQSVWAKIIFVFERILGEKTKLISPKRLQELLALHKIKGEIKQMNSLEYIFVGDKDGKN